MTQTISQILTDKGDNKTWHPVARAITGCPKRNDILTNLEKLDSKKVNFGEKWISKRRILVQIGFQKGEFW